GISTVLIPARAAASTLSLMPPTGSTTTRSEISPVIATSPRAPRPESTDSSAVASSTPAEGPSLGPYPDGTCLCTTPTSNTRIRSCILRALRVAVLRHRACRNVQVTLAGRERLRPKPQALGVGAHPRERRLGRLLHHVAELAGEAQPHVLAARHRSRLDEQDVAARVRAREAHHQAPL